MKRTWPGALAVLWASALAAEPLSRAEAVTRALESNPEVRRSREELAGLEGRAQEALADALPEVTFLGNALRYRDPSLLNSSSFDAFPPDLRASLRPIGANLFEGAGQLKQTVFSFKLGAAIRAAKFGSSLGREGVRRAQQAVALEAVRAYDGLLLARERVAVGQKAVRQKEKHLESVQNRRAAGVATELDVLRAEVDLANQKTQLLRWQGEAELALGALNAVMVRPLDERVETTDSLRLIPLEASRDEVLQEALANRAEVKGAELTEKVYDELIGVAKGEGRPRLDLVAAWGYSVREPTNFLERDFAKWNAAVTLTVPLFDGFRTRGKVAQARAEKGKATQDRIALENRIRLEAKEAFDRLDVAGAVVKAADLNVVQAQKAVDMVQANYGYGAATLLDVIDTQAALTLAESLRLQALYEHTTARATLRYVMGRDPLDPTLESRQ